MQSSGPSNRSILVTGGAGFRGSHLTSALVEDNDVTVFDALTTGDEANLPDGVTLIEGDVRDTAALEAAITDVDTVFHEAALVSVARSVEAPAESHSSTAAGTLTVLEAARKADARVVLASSAAIYGHPEYTPVDESHPKTPTSPYGLDKLAADHYARLYHEHYGLETVSLRYFNVYGPGQTGGDYAGVISVFIEQALNEEPITVHGSGDQTRDFVFVDDVVNANLLAAETDRVGTAYNVGTGESVTIRELAELIREIAGSESDIVHTEPREGDIDRSEADIELIRDGLGYAPTVSLRDGLERTVEWWKRS